MRGIGNYHTDKREGNQQAVLNALYQNGFMSFSELTQNTSSNIKSSRTVNEVLKDLVADGRVLKVVGSEVQYPFSRRWQWLQSTPTRALRQCAARYKKDKLIETGKSRGRSPRQFVDRMLLGTSTKDEQEKYDIPAELKAGRFYYVTAIQYGAYRNWGPITQSK